MSHEIITSYGQLFLVREFEPTDPQMRNANGDLLNPPQIYVFWRDEQNDCMRIEPISFGAARALVPRDFGDLVKKLDAARKAEWEAYSAARKAKEAAREPTGAQQ